MNHKHIVLFLLCNFCIISCNLHGQHEIYKQIQALRQAQTPSYKSRNLFSKQVAHFRSSRVSEAVKRSDLLKLNPKELKSLYESKHSLLELNLPFEQKGLELDLARVEIFTPDFRVTGSESGGRAIPVETGLFYRGIARNDPTMLVTISIFKDEVVGILATNQGNIVLGNYDKNKKEEYVIYNDHYLTQPFIFDCQTPDPEPGSAWAEKIRQLAAHHVLESRASRCLRLYLELDYDLVTAKGGTQGAINWISGVMNQVQALYNIDAITFSISQIFIWSTEDPYNFETTGEALDHFKQYRPTFNGDFAHLISMGKPDGGGIAFRPNQLCNSYNYAYSWIHSTYSSFPTYSWTVKVIAHETGHNLGSPHTHNCSWPGGAIDGCGPTANPTWAEGDCPIGPIPSDGGTTMSYCQHVSTGINFNKGFGPLPAALITSNINEATCLSATCSVPVTNPVNISATDGIHTDRIVITWTGNFGNYFRVYRNTSDNSAAAIPLGSWQASTVYDDYSVNANQTYYYWVRAASNSSGANISAFSSMNSGWRSAVTVTIPGSVSASDGLYTDQVAITWTGTSGNYFQIYRNTTNNSGTAIILGTWQTGTSFSDYSVNANQTYYYWVRAASNSSGANISAFSSMNSGWRSAVVVTIPSSVSASDGTYTDRVAITWTGTSGNYFQVYRNTTNTSGSATALGAWQSGTSFSDYSVNANQTYYYWVRAASNSSGANISAFSSVNSGWRSAVTVTVPNSVSASDGTYTDRVAITWTGTSGNYFQVYRNTTNTSGSASALGAWQTGTSFSDYSVTANQTYYYWVRAASHSSGANISAFSSVNSGWRSAITVTIPGSVSASDGTYTDRIAVNWTGTTNNYFRVYRNTINSSSSAIALGSWQTGNSYSDYSVNANQTYFYWVRAASNSSGSNISAFSLVNSGWRSAVTVTTPSSVSASDGTYTDRVAVTWTGTSGNYFQIYRNTTNNSGTATALGTWQTSTSFSDYSVNANQTYYYWVRAASNSSGANISAFSSMNSGWRSAITVTTPSSVSASDGTYTDRIAVTWTGSTSNYFLVYRNTTNSSASATALGSWQTATYFEDFSATPGQTYYYWVRAASSSGGANISTFSVSNSGYRNTFCGAPSNLQASNVGSSTCTLSWTGVNGVSQYSLWYYNGSAWEQFGTISSTVCQISNMSSGTQYCFAIKSICGTGSSSFSSSVCIYTTASDVASNDLPSAGQEKIISFKIPDKSSFAIKIFPNPVTALAAFHLQYPSLEQSQASIRIMDVSGKTISYTETELHIGENRISLDAPGIPGIYSVQLQKKTGEVKTIRLLVQ